MRTKIIATTFLLFGISALSAQENITALSLKECVEQAVERSISVVNARIDKEKSHYKVSETRSVLLPQINIGGSFQDNTKLPTTMLPGIIVGQPGTVLPVEIGTQYNTSATVTVNQVLYNQTALTSLKLSKQADNLNQLSVEKASESLAQEVAKLYFLAQTTAEQKALVEENISRTKRMTDITKTLLDNGMGKQVDYDRINVTLQNLYTQLSNTKALHEQQLNMLKYLLEIPIQTNIVLTDTAGMSLLEAEPVFVSDFSSHIDIRMLESQREIAHLNQKNADNGYIPTLSFIGQFGYQGMRNDFSNYFNNSSENKWYNSSYIGVSLSIPVFDGLQKRSKSRQAKLEYARTGLILDNAKERFNVDFKNAINNYYNNKTNVERQNQNINLAEKVYVETALKYREGLATMSDLLQDEMGLSNAQASYLNALYNFKEAEINIMSLNGEIKYLINK
jgi:outer membrane protein TolC